MKEKQSKCFVKYISYYDPPLVGLHIWSILYSFCIYIGSKIYIEKIFSKNIPIISLTDYKEKIEIYTKYLEKKNLTKSVANIWECTSGFRKVSHMLNCPFCKFELWFCKLNLWFHNLEVIPQLGDDLQLVSQLGGDFATWFAAAKMEFQLAKWHTCAWRWFRSSFCILMQLSSNDHNFFISTPICVPLEALDFWLIEIRNDI